MDEDTHQYIHINTDEASIMRRTTRKSLWIYLAGILVLAFFALMALIEADQHDNSYQHSMQANYATNAAIGTNTQLVIFRNLTEVHANRARVTILPAFFRTPMATVK